MFSRDPPSSCRVANEVPPLLTRLRDPPVPNARPEPDPCGRRPGPGVGQPTKKGNTFTVVPKRRVEPEVQPGSPEPPQDAPSADLGSLLKKRYPAAEEIQVIGGYLSLAKSCLSKTGSTGKKLKISFNESSLQSTYEYPSESSVWDSGDEDDEDKQDGKAAPAADEQPKNAENEQNKENNQRNY
uniref:Taperin n=1 Tax=Sphaeramia orbicularis TaxID=375764 RepID=A0A673AQY6_9TELE